MAPLCAFSADALWRFRPEERPGPWEPRRFYGPCGQLGYQYAARGGFTFLVSAGAGYALNAQGLQHRGQLLLGLGVGYTWRRGIMRAP